MSLPSLRLCTKLACRAGEPNKGRSPQEWPSPPSALPLSTTTAALAGGDRSVPSRDTEQERSGAPRTLPASDCPLRLGPSPCIEGKTFDPAGIPSYVGAFDIRSPFGRRASANEI